MSRLISILALIWALTVPAAAQEFTGFARIDSARSRISDAGATDVRIDLFLSQGVPYRIFTLDAPPRLVLDFREVDWGDLDHDTLQASGIAGVRFGTYLPGWSRMVLDLGAPMNVVQAGLDIDDVTGRAHLGVSLAPVSAERFAATAGAPRDPRWDLPPAAPIEPSPHRGPDGPLVVVLDPGHGGVDPGAEVDDVAEKDLMLIFARELRELLLRSGGFEVILTRDGDHFVSLERRIDLAHRAGADVFVSLHADSLAEGQAHGATVYTLSQDASDVASAKLAERHDRDQLLSGVDLSHADDQVTGVLLDLARQETRPRSAALAQSLVDMMTRQGGPMNTRPLRSATFSVLKAADIPSVLVEIGFLSSPRDRKNLNDPDWRAGMARGVRNGLRQWLAEDRARRALVRQ
ncbi:N-acetylmuramoyl-L-alanine amidase [Cribrihabitans marinus]|uniref:N-acetylmuramoyl-L-alanine amidase n=1 Tax=Cribrihabitans marinus TaxID=1227549 RepID=A0A1H6R0S9_9RHOB|nr:N-acetylmuramoyl-L-alanine amidase [Cribrihabitans marinus]GGH20017.1 N-acetylmuramoyl-L-alanine amidase [Cribrihabitans marinus]SEI48006.1 N-acetylmuramoyl-L-alanine amidase [Cribrihabitans marinus]